MLTTLIELDELVLSIRDQNTRQYVDEAVKAYRHGLHRLAIVSTWTSLVYDIIAKVRELSNQGDANAQQFVSALDAAIQNSHTSQLQQIENQILDTAQNDYELINVRERTDLDRLQQDRHLCAHPAFTEQALLFTPTAELVRAHIVHAIQHVLQHPPMQGRAALAQLRADIIRPSFPNTIETVDRFLCERYLNRARSALIEQMIGALLSVLFRGTDADMLAKPHSLAMTLVAIGNHFPVVYERRMKNQLPTRAANADDSLLFNVLLLSRYDSRCWDWVEAAVKIRLNTLITSSPISKQQWAVVGLALGNAELREAALQRFRAMEEQERADIIAEYPLTEFIDEAISLFGSSHSWRYAEGLGQRLMIPLAPFMSPQQLAAVLSSAASNSQVREAHGMPDIMGRIFDLTSQSRNQTADAWQSFNQRAAYHGLSFRFAECGMIPSNVDDEEIEDFDPNDL